jgi:hypothetical protein
MIRHQPQVLTAKTFADKDGNIHIERRARDPFVLYDAVMVLVPIKKYDSEEHRKQEWQEFVDATAGSCPDFPDPRDHQLQCPACHGAGYLEEKRDVCLNIQCRTPHLDSLRVWTCLPQDRGPKKSMPHMRKRFLLQANRVFA